MRIARAKPGVGAAWIMLLLPLGVVACTDAGPLLVSAQSPPSINSAASEPQPIGSLPPGASNPGAAGTTDAAEGSTHPSYVGHTFFIP